MDALRKFIVALFGFCIIVGVSVLTMIYGWGLTPRSWFWVLFGNTGGFLIGQAIVELSKDRK